MSKSNMWPIIISVEGNIGSGKSTILSALRNMTSDIDGAPVFYVDEPVRQWEQITNNEGKNMIELFYADPSKYAFSFQMMAYISRLTMLKDAIQKHPRSIIITERCLLTDYNIFASMLHEQGSLLTEEFSIYKQWFEYFQKDVPISAIVYIQCEPTVSHARCKSRGRVGEDIPLDYLVKCHQKHEDWILGETIPTLTIQNDTAKIEDVMIRICNFISEKIYA